LDDKTKQDLQAEVDAWSYGPAMTVGQPFGVFLTVHGLGCDLVNVSRDFRLLEQMRLSKPGLLQMYALTSSFVMPYLAATTGHAQQQRRMIALLKSRLDPYLSRSEVVDELKALRAANPEFSKLWDVITLSEAGTSAWDMPVSFLQSVDGTQMILEFHAFWSPYLSDMRIEIIRFAPTNRAAMRFVQEREDGIALGESAKGYSSSEE
jgi:hypothetical protein